MDAYFTTHPDFTFRSRGDHAEEVLESLREQRSVGGCSMPPPPKYDGVEWCRLHNQADQWARLAGVVYSPTTGLRQIINDAELPDEIRKLAAQALVAVGELAAPYWAKCDELKEEANSLARGERL